VRRLGSLPVQEIIALDHHEASLFRLGRDLPAGVRVNLQLGDVRNRDKIARLLGETRPQVIFHLAAYKHVPLGEYGPDEAVAVNIFGTRTVADAAAEVGSRHLVYPSSDKAVNPPSAYGATKRLAETFLLAHAAANPYPLNPKAQPPGRRPARATFSLAAPQGPTLSTHVVRLVNTLGTSGSVSETLGLQARTGAPLTLTDERMTRYWMAMDETIDLLIHSLGLPSGSRTLLDTGDPVPVQTIAERIYALVRQDGTDPCFLVTGLRPGERLLEELASANESLRPCDEAVLSVENAKADQHSAQVLAALDELQELLDSGDPVALHERLLALARQFQ
jgi:FlaA1/EpsC-like NDP-sugar epimerase